MVGRGESLCLVSSLFYLPFLLLSFEKHSKNIFALALQPSRTNVSHLFFFLYWLVQCKKKKFALLMLMYGVIFWGSFNATANALTKAIKQKQSTLPINTRGRNIGKSESTIDICISRNYLGMRMYPTTMQDFKSQICLVQIPV